MKCMKKTEGEKVKIVRVTDKRAEEIKHEGWEFCPKKEWKNPQGVSNEQGK
jgi:hypothetical protein